MRLAFVAPLNPQVNPGVFRKIQGQVTAFNHAGLACDLVVVTPGAGHVSTYLLQRLPFGSDCVPWGDVDIDAYDAFYIRRPASASRQLIAFLQTIRTRRPYAPIVFEVPTYPYDKEMRTFHRLPLLAKDRWHRKRFSGLIDRIADLSGTDSIFGVPTLPFFNGVDFEAVCPRTPTATESQEVHLVFSGTFYPWHGVDRMVRGLGAYYADRPRQTVTLHLMGDGPELKGAQDLARKLGLEDHCIFYGHCDARQMDEIYDQCSFALSSLGLHRIGISNATTLKSGEYLAKGLPFAYAGNISLFDKDPVDFCLQVPSDESPLDVRAIVDLHERLRGLETPQHLTLRIRTYAEQHISMDEGMHEVSAFFLRACAAQDKRSKG